MKKKILIIAIIIVILLIFVIYFVCNKSSEKYTYNVVSDISDINEAYDVKTCTKKFYNYCKDYLTSNPSIIYGLLDEEYIKYYDLTKNNFKKYIDVSNSDSIQIEEVYKIQERNNVGMYIVKSKLLLKNSDIMNDFNIILKIDKKNNTYSIFLNNYIEDKGYSKLSIGDKVNIKLKGIMEDSDLNNKYDPSNNKKITDNVEDIFGDYTYMCIFYEKEAYNLIDNEIKEKYSTYDIFDKYITDNIIDLVTMDLYSYSDVQQDNFIEYKCTSTTGQVFTFKVKSYITYSVTIE